MRQALLFGPRDLRVVEVPEPAPAAGQVTVRVIRSAPYGTDLDIYRAERPLDSYPIGLGADFSGVIQAIGLDVTDWQPGDRVVAMALYHCGQCSACRTGLTNLCLANPVVNSTRQECFQDIAIVWANKLARLPESVSFEAGAMLGGLMMGVNIFEKLRPVSGERLLVIGAGAMGWPQVALGRHAGLEVTVAGRGDRRLDLCRTLGATSILDEAALGATLADASRAIAPDGYPCIIETTASDWGTRLSLDLAALAARVAWTGGPPLTIEPRALVRREIALHSVRAGHHQDAALALLANGAIDLTPTITHRVSLSDLPAAFALLTSLNRGNVGRVMVEHDR